MNYSRPMIVWIATAVIIAGTILLLHEILAPFLVGVALAYLLDPLVMRLERAGVSRGIAALGMISLFYTAVIALLVFLTPLLAEEVAIFIEKFPGYILQLQTLATDPSRPWLRKIISEALSEAQQSAGDLTRLGANLSANLLHILWSEGRSLVSIFSLLVVTPIVTFYLLVDWEHIIAVLDKMVPDSQRETVRALARDIHKTLAVFLRGQGMICLILAVCYAVALRLIGLNHAYLIGLASGLISFAPYLGLLTGIVLSLTVALVQFWPSLNLIPVILGIFILGQSLADYVLAPRLIGERLNLSPLSILFAIAAFGYLFGFVGLLIAVPLAAAISVIVRFAMSHGVGEIFNAPEPSANPASVPPKERRWWF